MESRKEDDQATHHDVPSESQQRRMSLVLSDVVMMSVSGQALVRAESAAPSQGSGVTRSPLLRAQKTQQCGYLQRKYP